MTLGRRTPLVMQRPSFSALPRAIEKLTPKPSDHSRYIILNIARVVAMNKRGSWRRPSPERAKKLTKKIRFRYYWQFSAGPKNTDFIQRFPLLS